MRLSKNKTSLLKAAAVIAVFLIGGAFVPNFLKPANFLNVIRQCSIIAICAVGGDTFNQINGRNSVRC